eukprot:TRINITY_DN15700_c0_g1_i1.p1 TRINITY_DN15700_c0_g1~~TRINITY_DN15700_c0_g1_i1.p1  ORF type:complete len:322 (+),score=4.12 TRINITY_DN15700_c0_g1_i1:56-967(+)
MKPRPSMALASWLWHLMLFLCLDSISTTGLRRGSRSVSRIHSGPLQAHRETPLVIEGDLSPGSYTDRPGVTDVVVVVGSIPTTATVRSGGDIVVVGLLAGAAAAGCLGNRASSVVAMRPAGGRVTLAGVSVPFPASGPSVLCRLQGDEVTIVAYDPSWPTNQKSPRNASPDAAARASLITGAYIGGTGLSALIAPSTTFGIMFASGTLSNVWIRVLGALASLFGAYYIGTTWGDVRGLGARGFYWATVWGRFCLAALLSSLAWVTPTGRLGLLGLAAMNAIGAAFMWRALRSPTPPPFHQCTA